MWMKMGLRRLSIFFGREVYIIVIENLERWDWRGMEEY